MFAYEVASLRLSGQFFPRRLLILGISFSETFFSICSVSLPFDIAIGSMCGHSLFFPAKANQKGHCCVDWLWCCKRLRLAALLFREGCQLKLD